MKDIEIIGRIKNGEMDAFSILVERYHRGLLSYIHRLVGDEKITEDLGQEVFLDVYKSLQDFDVRRGTPFSAWLFILARNRCISELRKRKGTTVLSVDDVADLEVNQKSVEELLVEHEQRHLLASSIKKLAVPFRAPLVMSLKGCSLKEIADACGLSPGTVKSRLCRARQKLRLLVKVYSGGEDYEKI